MPKSRYTLFIRSNSFRNYEEIGVFDTSKEVATYIVMNQLDVDNSLVMWGHRCKVEIIENGSSLYMQSSANGHAYSWPIKYLNGMCPKCGCNNYNRRFYG